MILGGAAAAVLLTARQPRDAVMAAPTAIGRPFRLTAANGATVTDRAYRGKWLLVYFGYTYCPDACPTALNNIAATLDTLGSAANNLQALFITVDPRRDTPKAMGDYVKAFGHGIVGLTGSSDEITAVAKEYGVYISPHTEDGAGYLVDHSSFIYVINPEGRFVRVFSGDARPDGMAEQLHQLIDHPS